MADFAYIATMSTLVVSFTSTRQKQSRMSRNYVNSLRCLCLSAPKTFAHDANFPDINLNSFVNFSRRKLGYRWRSIQGCRHGSSDAKPPFPTMKSSIRARRCSASLWRRKSPKAFEWSPVIS